MRRELLMDNEDCTCDADYNCGRHPDESMAWYAQYRMQHTIDQSLAYDKGDPKSGAYDV